MIFSKHNGIPLEINYKKKAAKTPEHMETKQYDTNNQWVTEELKEEAKIKYLEKKRNQKHNNPKIYRMQDKQFYEGSLQR